MTVERARLGRAKKTAAVYADDENVPHGLRGGLTATELRDIDASMAAQPIILNRAHRNRESAWALGAITLARSDGTVIRTMAK